MMKPNIVIRAIFGITALLLIGLSIYRFVHPQGNDPRIVTYMILITPYMVLAAAVILAVAWLQKPK